MLKRFLTHCVHATHLRQMPLEIPYQRRLRAEINVFTPTEVARIHEIVTKENVRDRAIFMLLLDTGMRASEVCSLRLDDFRWERREVAIRAEVAKNRHARIIPLGASIPDLRRYLTARGMDQARCDAFFLAFYSTPAFSDIVSLQRILGHSRLDVTERYLRLLSSDIAEQHSRFSPALTFQGHSPKSDRCPARSHLVR
jgi:integrase